MKNKMYMLLVEENDGEFRVTKTQVLKSVNQFSRKWSSQNKREIIRRINRGRLTTA